MCLHGHTGENIVQTALQGRNGTIKEYISDGDYQVEIAAAITSEKDDYTKEELKKLMGMLQTNESIDVAANNDFLNLFGISNLIVKSYGFNQETHSNRQTFTVCCLSDLPYEIKLKHGEAMLKLGCEVTITSVASGNDKGGQVWVFDALSSCVIVEDTGSLTDTCVIELPKKISWEGDPRKDKEAKDADKPLEGTPIKRGDQITVRLGYFTEGSKPKDDDLKVRFSGYVRNVDTKVPVRIECEDGMFLLKQKPAKQKGFKETTLKEVISFLLEGTGVEYKLIDDKDIPLGPYSITKSTVAEELNELKREKSFMAYFRLINNKPVLYVGLHYPFDSSIPKTKNHLCTAKTSLPKS